MAIREGQSRRQQYRARKYPWRKDFSPSLATGFPTLYPVKYQTGGEEANGELALTLARVVPRLVEQIRLSTSRIEHAVQASEDARVLMSFPRARRICAAQILSELGSVRKRFDDPERLAAEAGKSKAVAFRWACNHRLRAALTCVADNSRHASAWACAIYENARARGCKHPHAIRILARAWLRVIWRAWRDRQPYDVQRHTGAMLQLTAAWVDTGCLTRPKGRIGAAKEPKSVGIRSGGTGKRDYSEHP